MLYVGLPIRNELKLGLRVQIETKEDQGTGKLTSGIIKEIFTSDSTHPHGIKVMLQNGKVGRVKKINSTHPIEASHSFDNLDAIAIPKTEDKYNEFKKFYQYDDNLDNIPPALGKAERKKAIEGIKRSVRERFTIAVCSFGNDSSGGFVYLGIQADGNVIGLEKDKRLGNFADYDDSFANHIRDTIEAFLNDQVYIVSRIQIRFRKVENNTICIVQILPSNNPLYVHTENGQQFYVRGPSPRAERLVDMKDQIRYIRSRFPYYG